MKSCLLLQLKLLLRKKAIRCSFKARSEIYEYNYSSQKFQDSE
jgi:hypothetical protein